MINKKIRWLKVINIKILLSFLWGWRAFHLLTASWCCLSLRYLLSAWRSLRWDLVCLLRNWSSWLFATWRSCRFYLNCITSFCWCYSFFMLRNLWIFASRCSLWQLFNLDRDQTFACSRRFRSSWLNLDWLVLTVVLRVLNFRLFHLGVLIDIFHFFFGGHLFPFFCLGWCRLNISSGHSIYLFPVILLFVLGIVFLLRFIGFLSWGFYLVGVLFYSLWMLCSWGFAIAPLSLSLRLNGAIVYFFKVLVKVLAEHLGLFYGDF